jgi:hypothetical protein
MRSMALGVIAALASVGAHPATLDQGFVPSTTTTINGYVCPSRVNAVPCWLAQSFTAGVTGELSSLDLAIWKEPTFITGVTVMVFTLNGNALGQALGGTNIPSSSVPNGNGQAFPPIGANPFALSVNLAGLGINVSAGATYVVATTNDVPYPSSAGNGILWLGSDPFSSVDIYTRGSGFVAFTGSLIPGTPLFNINTMPTDLGFRTYVTPIPEPASAFLLSLGLTLLALRARR